MAFDTPEFKKLKALWDKKLAASGLEDIEQSDGNLKVWSTRFRTHHADPTLYQSKEEYFRRAGQFLHSHKFPDQLAHEVWTLHADGMSNREIAKRLKIKTIARINAIVKNLREIMLEQLKSHTHE